MKIKRETHHDGAKHLVRFVVTAIAVAAVLAVVIIKGKIFGEFTWHIGW
jgi:hypothetical protein